MKWWGGGIALAMGFLLWGLTLLLAGGVALTSPPPPTAQYSPTSSEQQLARQAARAAHQVLAPPSRDGRIAAARTASERLQELSAEADNSRQRALYYRWAWAYRRYAIEAAGQRRTDLLREQLSQCQRENHRIYLSD